jgi:hypothetical protein
MIFSDRTGSTERYNGEGNLFVTHLMGGAGWPCDEPGQKGHCLRDNYGHTFCRKSLPVYSPNHACLTAELVDNSLTAPQRGGNVTFQVSPGMNMLTFCADNLLRKDLWFSLVSGFWEICALPNRRSIYDSTANAHLFPFPYGVGFWGDELAGVLVDADAIPNKAIVLLEDERSPLRLFDYARLCAGEERVADAAAVGQIPYVCGPVKFVFFHQEWKRHTHPVLLRNYDF